LIPVYKKDSVPNRNNYRPISILPITSKPLERHVAKSYLGYLTSNNLIHRNHSAYRPHHSCAKDEKLVGAKIDRHLNWNNHIDFLIDPCKLNSRICLLRRAKTYLNYRQRNLLYNALIGPLFEYFCTVWGNTIDYNFLRLLRVQKRCARLILDASFSNNSVELFSKLYWLPIDDVIRMRKLCLMYKIVKGCCPEYFKDYIFYVNDKHRHNTRASTKPIIHTPFSYQFWSTHFLCNCQPIMEQIRW